MTRTSGLTLVITYQARHAISLLLFLLYSHISFLSQVPWIKYDHVRGNPSNGPPHPDLGRHLFRLPRAYQYLAPPLGPKPSPGHPQGRLGLGCFHQSNALHRNATPSGRLHVALHASASPGSLCFSFWPHSTLNDPKTNFRPIRSTTLSFLLPLYPISKGRHWASTYFRIPSSCRPLVLVRIIQTMRNDAKHTASSLELKPVLLKPLG
ncbi:hypothetical protein IWX49DRAFT_309511 [Phyllosticta citricarpa]|uniref:Uncharacterized protein n=2 Tax=Phyllosticta TaxID=121621 RepID=A0ABR1LH84_9PEZI